MKLELDGEVMGLDEIDKIRAKLQERYRATVEGVPQEQLRDALLAFFVDLGVFYQMLVATYAYAVANKIEGVPTEDVGGAILQLGSLLGEPPPVVKVDQQLVLPE